MKKLAITTTIILGLGLASFANPEGGGLFQRGEVSEAEGVFRNSDMPILPLHNQNANQDANQTPLGSGIAMLLGLGAAYMVGMRRREE